MTGLKIWFAPLHGITNYIFRNVFNDNFGGIDCFMSPFVAVQSKASFNKRIWADIFPENNSQITLIPQLMGNDAQQFADTMLFLNDNFGYDRFNINLGCPSSKVVRHRRGCGLLPNPGRIEEIVRKSVSTNFNISLKMRTGLKSVEEGMEVLRRIRNYPLDFIVLHPRLGVNLYDGSPDLEVFSKFCAATKHKIVYSGDIFSKEDFDSVSRRFPDVHSWMLGRGLLRNPFLAEEIKGVNTGDKINGFLNFYNSHVDALLNNRTEHGTLSQLKELWHYYAYFMKLDDDVLKNLLRISDFNTFYQQSKSLIC